MTKFLSVLSLLCVCWALPSPSGTWLTSMEMPGTDPEDAAKFMITASEGYPKAGMTSFAGNPPSIFSHLPAAKVRHNSLLPFFGEAEQETADSIAVSRESVTFSEIGAAITLTATVFDAKGAILDDAPLIWIAANPAVATVDQNGVVTAVGNGTTRIAITAGTVTVRISVLVESNEINPESERKVLVTFYETTDGENWDQNTNWQSEHPLNEWYGVRTDEKGSVTGLRLTGNDLAGPIPPELGGLSALVRLELSGNQLSGSIPAALGTLEDLEVLNLSENDLAGELPERIGNLSSLITLDVSVNAQLTGALPVTLPRLDALDEFRYDGTELCVPEVTAVENWLAGLSVHRGTGQLCAPTTDREVLEDLYAALGGAQWANADNWNTNAPLEDWQGITLDGQGRVSRVDLRGQGLNGALPSGIATLTYLTHLILDDNNLEGPIPPELGTLEDLVHLRAHSAALTGGLPGELGNLENLKQLDLSDNDLAGAIPAAWGDLGSLNELSLNTNRLSGPLPSELGRLSELHTLSIADNQGLSGEVPASFVNLEALRVFHADGTRVCLPANPLLQSWNDGLTTSSLPLCAPPAEPALELSVSNLSVTEGGTETYTVQLASEPTGTVTIAVTGHAGTDLKLDRTNLTFNRATWNVAQTVTVTADPDVDAISETIPLVHTASGADYANVQATLTVTVADRDAATLNLSASALPVDEGSSTTYTLRLASEPAGTVTVAITGHAGTSLKLDKTALTFTREIWNIAQTVTVTASPDANATSEIISLLHAASGANYEAVQATVMVTVADRDAATLNLSTSALSVTEESSNTYTLRLSSEPAGTVTVAITGHAGTALKLDKATLTFTQITWNVAQTVTVTAAPDANAVNETIPLVHAASGANYENVRAELTVTVTDDDPAGVLIVSPGSISIPEGSQNTYTVRLSSEPAGTVAVAMTGHSGTELKPDKTSLTFTAATWNAAQTVTVSAEHDLDADEDHATLLHTASGADYAGVTAKVEVTVKDDDAPGTLVFSSATLSVTEGSRSTYTVQLSRAPTAAVTADITGFADTDLTLDKTSLTFTPTTWNQSQAVTVNAGPDDDGTNDTATLIHTTSGANYDDISGNVAVTIEDADTPALEVSVSNLTIDEGNSSNYTVRLATKPATEVIIGITGFANTDLMLDKTSLTFTAVNWNQDQTITVSADQDLDGTDDTATLAHTASGADYGGETGSVTVTVNDDDVPGALTFSSAGVSVPEGDRNTYTIQLSRAPTSAVTVDITGHAGTALTLDKTSLTFTPATWNRNQTVTLTARPDDDGRNESATLVHTASGANYGGVIGNVAVTIHDDDTPELDLSASSLTINEGDSKGYTVRLTTKPATDVTITITGHTGTDLSLDKENLTFTSVAWNQNQTVTVSADDDLDADNDTATLLHTASGDDYGNVTANISVIVMDDDTANLDLSASNLEISEEENRSYTVRLSSIPTADVTVSITGYANTDLTLDKTELTFTQATWNQNQAITVTAGPDDDGMDDTATLVHTASGANYGGISENIAVTIKDDDTPGTLLFSSETISVPEGGSTTYTVQLSSAPTAAVTVEISGHANTDLELDKTSLTFSAMTWNQPRTITVTADTDNDARNESATLVHTTSGANYDGVNGNVSVTINDDDTATPGLYLSVPGLEMNEGGSQSYTVELNTQPTADVTVSISNSSRSTDLTLSSTRLSFTDQNWDTAQTVTLTSKEDSDWTTDYERLTHTASGGDYGGMSTQFLVSVMDNDSPPAPPHAYVFQTILPFFNTVPLIAGESAFLRVFPTANAPNSTPLPKAVATFYLNDMVEHTATIAGKSGPIPTEVWPHGFRLSLSADIPASVIQPGLEMVVEIDPDDTVPDHLGVTKRIPSTGRMSIDVVTVPTLNLTLIPFVTTGHTESQSIVTIVENMASNPNGHSNLWTVRTLLPIKDISATAHATVTVDTRDSYTLHTYTALHRAAEGGSGYWIGLHSDPDGPAGVSTVSGTSSFSRPNGSTIAHELAHNLSLLHAPCGRGIRFVDSNYPYANASIGSWGYLHGSMRDPDRYKDLMSYCGPEWISDYSFNKALGYYQSKSSTAKEPPLVSASIPSEISLLLWGGMDAVARPFLEPVFEVDAAPVLPREPGPWQLAGHSASGEALFHLTFAMPVIAHGDGRSSFAFVIPLQQEQAPLLTSVTLSGPDGSYTIDEKHNTPMAIVLDQASGQITGILNNYNPLNDDHRITAISNKAGGGHQRVLFSRGLPNLGTRD